MSEYVPKVGDKVKARLGESVIVGRVDYVYDGGGANKADGIDVEILAGRSVTCRFEDGWQFEQVVSVPTKFGAVIRRADGVHFVRDSVSSRSDAEWMKLDGSVKWGFTSDATAGGFTVLFEGVDE